MDFGVNFIILSSSGQLLNKLNHTGVHIRQTEGSAMYNYDQ